MTQRIALIDFKTESRQQVMATAMLALEADIQWLNDPADYARTYAAGPGPEIAILGLDENPTAVLEMARHIVAKVPGCGLVAYASSPSPELMMQAMGSEVRRFINYPLDAAALKSAIAAVYRPNHSAGAPKTMLSLPPASLTPMKSQVIALFSAKGGVGTTTIAANLACALRPRNVLIIDANVSFGNVGMFFDTSTNRSMIDLSDDPREITMQSIESVTLTHPGSGVKMILSPPKPEQEEQITTAHLCAIIEAVRSSYDYVIIDTYPSYEDRVLAVLNAADRVVMPVGPDYPALKNAAAFLRVAGLLQYPREKIIPVLVRADTVKQEHIENAEKYLKRTLECRIVSDGIRVTDSINKGTPFILTDPNALVSRNLVDLSRLIEGDNGDIRTAPVALQRPFTGVVKRIFARRAA